MRVEIKNKSIFLWPRSCGKERVDGAPVLPHLESPSKGVPLPTLHNVGVKYPVLDPGLLQDRQIERGSPQRD